MTDPKPPRFDARKLRRFGENLLICLGVALLLSGLLGEGHLNHFMRRAGFNEAFPGAVLIGVGLWLGWLRQRREGTTAITSVRDIFRPDPQQRRGLWEIWRLTGIELIAVGAVSILHGMLGYFSFWGRMMHVGDGLNDAVPGAAFLLIGAWLVRLKRPPDPADAPGAG